MLLLFLEPFDPMKIVNLLNSAEFDRQFMGELPVMIVQDRSNQRGRRVVGWGLSVCGCQLLLRVLLILHFRFVDTMLDHLLMLVELLLLLLLRLLLLLMVLMVQVGVGAGRVIIGATVTVTGVEVI